MRAQRAPARLASRSGAGKALGGRHRRGGRSPPARPDLLLWGRYGSVRGNGVGRPFQPAGGAEKGLSFTAPLCVAFVT